MTYWTTSWVSHFLVEMLFLPRSSSTIVGVGLLRVTFRILEYSSFCPGHCTAADGLQTRHCVCTATLVGMELFSQHLVADVDQLQEQLHLCLSPAVALASAVAVRTRSRV